VTMIESHELAELDEDHGTVGGVRLRALPADAAGPEGAVRNAAAEQAVRELLIALGEDPDRPGLRETPRRVAASLAELLTPVEFTPTTFPNEEGYDQLIMARDIDFSSLCEHHMLPFHGVAHVGYIPGERIVGLSKLARVVEMYSRDLQVQERLTGQIASWLDDELQPVGVGVVLEAEHTCMALRGVRKPGSRTITSALRGAIRDDARTRSEFLALATGRAEER
jgi:GTP cyclohydrolase IA